MEADRVRDEESLSTHPPTKLNIKRTQKFLKMGESESTKAAIPLKAMKNLHALGPHYNRATLCSLLSHA